MGLDTKIYWLTDRQSQCDYDFDLITGDENPGDRIQKDKEEKTRG
jgi:hypothetical protein